MIYGFVLQDFRVKSVHYGSPQIEGANGLKSVDNLSCMNQDHP